MTRSDLVLIHVALDDELTDVLEHVAKSKGKTVVLMIPGRSLLLSSSIHFQLLKKKAEKEGKQLLLLTKDRVGRVLAEKAGIQAFKDERAMNSALHMSLPEREEYVEDEDEDVLRVEQHTIFGRLWAFVIKVLGVNEDMERQAKQKLHVLQTSKKAFVSILVMSGLLLWAVIFFAWPDATIRISPRLENVPADVNVTLSPEETDVLGRKVRLEPLEVTYTREITFPTSGRTFMGEHATGKVMLFNESAKDRSIVANSRLQNDRGLVFLTKNFVTIPGGTPEEPGTVEVEVRARELDVEGEIIGERGNVGSTEFFFPALGEGSKSVLYGRNEESFSGGTSEFETFVQKEDLEDANRAIVLELENFASEELHKALGDLPLQENGDFDIFQIHDKRFVQRNLVSVEVPRDIVSDKVPSFKVTGTMTAKAYYYNRDDVIAILEHHLRNHKLTYTDELMGMDEKTLRFINIFPPRDGVVKITATMNGLVSYSFHKDDQDLIDEIKMSVAGISRDDAVARIQNLPEVDSVEVHLSPMWQKDLPPLKENIRVVVEEL